MSKINKTSVETRLAIERRSAAMLPDRPTQAGFKPWDIRNALFSAIIADKGACLMGEIDRIVDETNAAIDAMRIKSGTLTVPTSRWKGEETPRAECVVNSIYTAGCAVLFMPEDDETKEQARLARISMAINETIDGEWSDVVVFVGEGGEIPSVDLHFRYFVIPTESEEDAVVTLVGVDAYGEGGGGAASGVDEDAVKKIINFMLGNVANERQYSAANPPPYPVTSVNGKTGAVSLSAEDIGARPASWTPTPADIGAEINGTASALLMLHDVNEEAHGGAIAQIPTLQSLLSTVIGTDTGKSMRAVAALVIAESLKNAPESLDSLEELAAWIAAHPADVAALVARIVKLETDITTKIAEASIVNNLTTNDATKPLSAAQGAVLKALINALTTTVNGKADGDHNHDGKYQPKGNYQPAGDYAPENHNHDDVYAAKSHDHAGVYQPAGSYAASDHNHDDKYQPKGNYLSQHQSLDHLLLKNMGAENAGKFLFVSTDGTVIPVDLPELAPSGDVVGNFDTNGDVVLNDQSLTEGVYTLYYLDDAGEAHEYARMTVVNTYAITWIVDGKATTERVKEGDIPAFSGSTDKASDSQYTYTFKGWDKTVVAATEDVTYTAVYDKTAIEVKPTTYTITWVVDGKSTTEDYDAGATPAFKGATDKATDDTYDYTFTGWNPAISAVTGDKTYTAQYKQSPKNWLKVVGYKTGKKLSTSKSTYTEATNNTTADACASGLIPVNHQDTYVYVKNVTLSATASINNVAYYDASGNKLAGQGGIAGGWPSSYVTKVSDGVYKFRGTSMANMPTIAYAAFSCGTISDDTIVTVGMEPA